MLIGTTFAAPVEGGSPAPVSGINGGSPRFVPGTCRYIKEYEKKALLTNIKVLLGTETKKRKTPWLAFLKPTVLALFLAHFAGDFGFYLFSSIMPILMTEIFSLPRSILGFASALPFLALFITIQFGGYIPKIAPIHSGTLVGIGNIFSGLAGMMGPVLMAAMTPNRTREEWRHIFYFSNRKQIAPIHSGTLVGIGNTLSGLAGMMGPVLMAAMTPNRTREEWRHIFYFSNRKRNLLHFVKTEVRDWAKQKSELKSTKNELNSEIKSDTNFD
uniref:MFS domain-containing protein n=1 Tax=Rhabditophanes sp. KR3021 TaxID=114890 RepID=A0AC35UCF5_9BILA